MSKESDTAMEKLRAELEAQHQTSINQLKALWSKEKETEIQLQVDAQVASAKAAWKEELHKVKSSVQLLQLLNGDFMLDMKVCTVCLQMEKTWVQRLEVATRETAEASCQADDIEASSGTITVEELNSRLSAQKQQLQMEADKVKRKAVEEARKRIQKELHEKHLEDMAKQVSGVYFIKLVLVGQSAFTACLYKWHQFSDFQISFSFYIAHHFSNMLCFMPSSGVDLIRSGHKCAGVFRSKVQ